MTQHSFAPMRPAVETRTIETQTESEPLKRFESIDSQTDLVETVSIRVQTENAETKDGSMQTLKALTGTVESQTDKTNKADFETQVNLSSSETITET